MSAPHWILHASPSGAHTGTLLVPSVHLPSHAVGGQCGEVCNETVWQTGRVRAPAGTLCLCDSLEDDVLVVCAVEVVAGRDLCAKEGGREGRELCGEGGEVVVVQRRGKVNMRENGEMNVQGVEACEQTELGGNTAKLIGVQFVAIE